MAVEIVLDTISVAQERLEQALELLDVLSEEGGQLDNAQELALELIQLAEKAEAQAKIALNVLQAAANSPVANEIEQMLGTNFSQEVQRMNGILKQA